MIYTVCRNPFILDRDIPCIEVEGCSNAVNFMDQHKEKYSTFGTYHKDGKEIVVLCPVKSLTSVFTSEGDLI